MCLPWSTFTITAPTDLTANRLSHVCMCRHELRTSCMLLFISGGPTHCHFVWYEFHVEQSGVAFSRDFFLPFKLHLHLPRPICTCIVLAVVAHAPETHQSLLTNCLFGAIQTIVQPLKRKIKVNGFDADNWFQFYFCQSLLSLLNCRPRPYLLPGIAKRVRRNGYITPTWASQKKE